MKLADFYVEHPDEIFPPGVLAVKEPKAVRTLDASDVQRLLTDGQREMVALPSDCVEERELRDRVADALSMLTTKQQQVLRLRFGIRDRGDGCTLEEVGAHLGVKKERVRQIEAKALRVLRHPSRAKALMPYIDPDKA